MRGGSIDWKWEEVSGREGIIQTTESFTPCSFLVCSSGDGSLAGLQSEERSPAAMAQAVRVHEEINKVMYFA